jgi:hypothetical protein
MSAQQTIKHIVFTNKNLRSNYLTSASTSQVLSNYLYLYNKSFLIC